MIACELLSVLPFSLGAFSRALAKNTAEIVTLFALSNPVDGAQALDAGSGMFASAQ